MQSPPLCSCYCIRLGANAVFHGHQSNMLVNKSAAGLCVHIIKLHCCSCLPQVEAARAFRSCLFPHHPPFTYNSVLCGGVVAAGGSSRWGRCWWCHGLSAATAAAGADQRRLGQQAPTGEPCAEAHPVSAHPAACAHSLLHIAEGHLEGPNRPRVKQRP